MHKSNVQPFFAILLAIASVILPSSVQASPETPGRIKQLPNLQPRFDNRGQINDLMYQRIKPGMTLTQVENIIGFAGTPNPEAAFGAQQAYTWSNFDGSQITVWTRNNRVVIVGKFGLPDVAEEVIENAEVSLLSYGIFELIKPGMTVADVALILGFPGRLEPELSTIDTAQVWRWDNLNGDYIRVYLGEGVVVSKFTSILNVRPIGITQAEVNAQKIQAGFTLADVEDILSKGIPYPDPYETELKSWLWKYEDGSVLLIVFKDNEVLSLNIL
ncbi:MAG: hypothetical protein SAJ12_21950 [Jaaginema sp. PMC 1079.18]|nr:hypothetical protein [Jaaginema sp. PMC 1080.18]MEC4853654.1 hypothetical protein [Jaaginema sp. PMC 1079.18]MEC4868875.1 hypothetical protein [Jaaginema sp. PMC 1078.18]